MRRVVKPPYVNSAVWRKVAAAVKSGSKKPIRIYARACVIIPQFVGFTFEVHNGKDYKPVVVNERMIGYRFGMFVPTRTFKGHSDKKKEVKKK
jgi:small subunit ribosomal protein S19